MIRYQQTLALNQEDKDKEDKLTSRGITKIAIYRAGLDYLLAEAIKETS